MGDIAFEHVNEVLALRDAGGGAAGLDSTTLLTAEIERIRDLDLDATLQDTNTELEIAWDGVR